MAPTERATCHAAVSVRLDPQLLRTAQLGLMLPLGTPVSVIVRAALELAAGVAEPTGEVDRGGWRPRRRREVSYAG